MLDGELIKWHIIIERFNHPVAIRPNGSRIVFLVAICVGVACQIEPFTSPALAILRRGEQAIHRFFVGIGSGIGEIGGQFFRRRWQADEIKTQPPVERSLVSLRRGLQSAVSEGGSYENIDGIGGF